jgi:hypothetical protein
MANEVAGSTPAARLWAWRRSHLRLAVVAMAVLLPVLLAAVLIVLVASLDATLSQALAFVGTGLLAIGAVLQVFASSREIKDREGTAVADGFVLGGWMVIFLGAVLSFVSVLASIGE